MKVKLNKGLTIKNGSWVIVKWSDAPDEIGYVAEAKPTKKAQYATLFFLRGKKSHTRSVNYDQIVAVVPTYKIRGFDLTLPSL